jgi:hypothetical protein
MFPRLRQHRFALWAMACVLLLQSAMPFLARAAAQVQGRTLVEICTVYGVSTVVLDADGQAVPSDPHQGLGHAGEGCALGALIGFVDAPERSVRVRAPWWSAAASPPFAHNAIPLHAEAAWVARRKHGPPLFG